MRDPARIPRILRKLQLLWLAVPDQRLGQLINNLNTTPLTTTFHVEDDEWELLIERAKKEWTGGKQ